MRLLWSLFFGVCCASLVAGQLVIDNFSVNQGPFNAPPTVTDAVSGTAPAIIGGEREILFDASSGATFSVAGGQASFVQPGAGTASLRFIWDGSSDAIGVADGNVGPINLLSGGATGIVFTFGVVSFGTFTFAVHSSTPPNPATSCVYTQSGVTTGGPVITATFGYGLWSGGGCNLANIHSMELEFSTTGPGQFLDLLDLTTNGACNDANQFPVLNGCHSSTRSLNTNFGQCCATDTFSVTASDPDPCATLTGPTRTGPASGTCFTDGQSVSFTVSDSAGHSDSCSWTYAITDNEIPTVSCPSNQQVNNSPGACEAPVTFTVTSADNCAGETVEQLAGQASGTSFPVGSTTNQFRSRDTSNNLSSTCSFIVQVSDVDGPSVTCPADVSSNTDPGLCTAVTPYTILSSDNCPGETQVLNQGLPSGSAFPLGTTFVEYQARDASNNFSPPCSFNVVVSDNELPLITCPADITVPSNSAGCSAVVPFSYIVSDNCPSVTVDSSHPSGGFFTGVTDVTGTATDTSGNVATCTFRITVIDSIAPTITCFGATEATDPGACSATVFFRDPSAFDTCGVDISRTGTAVSGNSYAPGTYTSTFTATDPSSNTASCTTTIEVVDREPPVVTGCPSDIVLGAASGSCEQTVTWDESAVTRADNCGVSTSSQSHTPGSVFPLGVTSVSYSATDAAGNTGQCSFTVEVTADAGALSYSQCPSSITVESSCSDSGTAVSWQRPTLSAPSCLSYEQSNFVPGDRFPDGVTTVYYVAVADQDSTTCLFDITVQPCNTDSGNRPPGAIGTIDLDGDGYYADAPLIEWRDCCDSPEDLCDDPFLVNPGAFEIAANGQQDSCRGTTRSGRSDVDGHIGGCDREFVFGNDFQLVGPTIPSEQTNEAVWALDLCEFKEDDDDPSWGFDEQQTMVFSLANGTRNGYDIGIVGPALTQASVVDHYGGIVPARGDFMLAISTGTARDEATGGHLSPSGATTGNTVVNLPAVFLNSGASTFVEDCGGAPYAVGVDSIRAHFRMHQPTNMHAFSFQALYMDNELEAAQGSYPALGGTCDANRKSWFLAIKSDSKTGVSGNFAGDSTGRSFNSFNANPEFWSQCNDYGDFSSGLCRDGDTSLELTGFTGASKWIPIGTSAEPGESFSLEFVTFDGQDGANDVTVLLDDFFPITEARTMGSSSWASQPWGYQYTADLELVSFGFPNGSPVLSKTVTSATLEFTLRNWGPEEANDVTIAFTPPLGARFTSAKDSNGGSLSCTTQPAASPYEDNGLVKCKWPTNEPLANQATRSGSIAFAVDLDCAACPAHTSQMRFRLTSTLSSIDRQLSNNYLTADAVFV